MKNHYISQFIIRCFSNAINVFDLKTGRIDESKRPQKIFYKEDIFDEELEKLMNFNIESRVANILNNKIIDKEEVRLLRGELEILKTYTLLCSVRSLSEDKFCDLLLSFEDKANRYINIHKYIDIDYSHMPSTKSLKLSNHELFLRSLKVFATCKNIRDISLNPLGTREMLAWAMPFLESYIAFWDAPKDKEFVLSDSGMCSEYEGFHMLTGGLDISKMSYLLEKIKNGDVRYSSLMCSDDVMYENYSIFNLSSNRLLVIINPFFSLYYNYRVATYDKNGTSPFEVLDKPDIWPAQIQNVSLFETPKNEYKYGEPYYCYDDIFVYTPKQLNDEELIYINSLLLTQSKEIIGFNNPLKIIDSIYYEVWFKSNFESVKSLNDKEEEIINRLFENVVNSPFNELIKYCQSIGGINKTAFILLFEKLLSNLYKDFYNNPYIYRYYLNLPEETMNNKHLDWMEKGGTNRLDIFKKMLDDYEKRNRK